ncbi:MAG: NAD(P)H-hydrate dehydratase [Fimbriimonadaceae bacterium]|nr:NAD(P)H-hydrate dehydratase [Fimbriimonadaceae bacterium]
MWIADVARSREIDRRSTEEFGLPALVLMERAGLAVYEALRRMLPESGRVGVVCGKGNNGGDAFVLARLAHRHGLEVECLVAATERELQPDCRHQMLQARALGVQPVFCDDGRWHRRLEGLRRSDLIVDGILGTGAKGEVREAVREAIHAVNRSGVPVLSIDVPSGIETDTGTELGESVWALKTVTLGTPKPCLFQGIGMEHCGRWEVADIGYPRELTHTPTEAYLLDSHWVGAILPERLRSTHKGNNGHVLIVAGSRTMRGAAVLAAKSAYRAGAGVVTVAAVPEVCDAIAVRVPEALLLPLPSEEGVLIPAGAEAILRAGGRATAALFGPGLTHEAPVQDLLDRLWRSWEIPSVIDADALNAVARGVSLPPGDCLLTPHPGEMSRLMATTTAEVQADRFHTAQACAMKHRRSVVLKGAYSVAAGPCDPLLVNPTGNPGMASAGMGDVLGGMAAALLGQDLGSYYAGGAAMYWHGVAGDLCEAEIGEVGFTARDVCRRIPQARAKIMSACTDSSLA